MRIIASQTAFALLLIAALARAQEFPTSPTPTTFDCTTGCGLMRHQAVTCWAFARQAEGEQGPRCRAYCQYEGMPFYYPGPGWSACSAVAPRGLACNATEYVYPPAPGSTRVRMACDGGTADGLVP